MRISDWSADVCSSDLAVFAKGGFGASGAGWVVNREVFDMQKFTMKLWTVAAGAAAATTMAVPAAAADPNAPTAPQPSELVYPTGFDKALSLMLAGEGGENGIGSHRVWPPLSRSEEHTSELQSLMRLSYAVCCLN